MFTAAIRPSTFLQASSSPCAVKNCSKFFLAEAKCCHFHSVIKNAQLPSLEDNSSALFFSSSRPLMKSESSSCTIYVVQHMVLSGKIADLVKQMAMMFLQIFLFLVTV
jgi:hypothetical protein